MEEAYNTWKAAQTPKNMGALLDAADPTIQSAIQSYAGGNPSLKSRARYLAAQAFKTYDPSKGTKLSTHLMTQLQPLVRSNREYTQITKIPERISVDMYKLNQARQQFQDQRGREPSDKELADFTGMSFKRINKINRFGKGVTSESAASSDSEDNVTYPGINKVDPNMIWQEFVHHDLGPIDQQILEWKTGYNNKPILSTNDIAKKLRLTPGAVSQRAKRIADRLNEGANFVE